MEQLLTKLGHQIGLRPETWLDWLTCSPDWIVPFCWYCGVFVAIAYLIFSIVSALLEKEGRKQMSAYYLFYALSFVFVMCAALHFIHVESKYFPEIMVLTVFLYPPLIIAMLALIPISLLVKRNIDEQRKSNVYLHKQKDQKIKELEKIINENRVTQSAINLAKGKLDLLKTMESANDEFVIVEGKNWEIPIFYDKWTAYKIGNDVCRLIGIYLNEESTLIINEFPKCYFPTHAHVHTETCTVLVGEIEMNDVTYQVGETVHFKANQPHWLKTKGATIAVIWNTKLETIKGE